LKIQTSYQEDYPYGSPTNKSIPGLAIQGFGKKNVSSKIKEMIFKGN
jgi:hypothetical protein